MKSKDGLSKKQVVARRRNWSKRVIAAMYYLPSSVEYLTPVEAMQLDEARATLSTLLTNWDDNTKSVIASIDNSPVAHKSPLDKQ